MKTHLDVTQPRPLLLKPEAAAQLLGIGRSTLYEMILRREIPSLKIGGCRRIPYQALEAWIAERMDETG